MAPVEGSQFWFVQTFDDGKDGCIDEPDIRVGVAITEISCALIVLQREVLDFELATGDSGEKAHKDAGVETVRHEPIELDKNGGGNDEQLAARFDQVTAGPVVRVVTVQIGKDRPGVED